MVAEEGKAAAPAEDDVAVVPPNVESSGPPEGFKETNPFASYVLDAFPVVGFASQTAFAYNIISISISLEIIDRMGKNIPGWATDIDSVAVYGGAIFGMITMGYLGDLIGRKPAMTIALSFVIFGALSSGLLTFDVGTNAFYQELGLYRFIVGCGVGGVVPLSTASTVEVTGSVMKKRWVTVFCYMGNVIGYTMPYVVTLVLAGFDSDYPLMWRAALFCGAMPALAVLQMNIMKEESAAYLRQRERQQQSSTNSSSEIMECLRQPKYWLKLAGTGGTWFFQNIPVYGIRNFASTILDDVFQKDGQYESMADLSWQNIILNSLQIIGVVLTLYLLPVVGSKKILCMAPVIIGVLCAVMGVLCNHYPDQTTLIFLTFCAMYSFLMFGFGPCNYLASSEHYPVGVRSTFAGFSAACSKLGAIVGIIWFDWCFLKYGTGATLYGCAVWFAVCFLWTVFLAPEDEDSELFKDVAESNKGATEPLVKGSRTPI
mmetsp:Transcript_81630/g.231459  ORF Transcript_81630/g.231459 Transcript_81630/m.231459 type:complete len:487 (-) Transcript_81630:175-1635(-)|eukprot:CAMPEP_0119501390 /NCGR_PEP_ID=MMETSP1344-20130328/23237_1 /TAXON_ID=236787 /ORGANISM="Florenciella parvula, Strain CCMP2471" /LENGTH=486 /DNA_ID=CAMNT_0007537547 /DNA_START=154 /DNA_END=1614 /DNA_ORIENTATION=-